MYSPDTPACPKISLRDVLLKSIGILLLSGAFISPVLKAAPSVVAVGNAGSYASEVPEVNWYVDSYYGLPAGQVEPFTSDTTTAIYGSLHMDPSLVGKAIPTNHWWTDLLVANRSSLPKGSNQYILQQDLYGGNMWFLPGVLAAKSYGLDFYFPNSWNAANSNGNPQGGFNQGSALPVKADIPYFIPAGDILIADFENGYPAGTTRTGNGFAATPSDGGGYSNMMGLHCANTRDGG
ncbi:MAG: hypothetical protein WCH43_02895, partial [Verrucomicrobiota bacterium]